MIQITIDITIYDTNHACVSPSAPSPPNLRSPLAQLEHPASSHHDAADDVDQPHQQPEEAAPALAHDQQDRLNVVLEKQAGDGVTGDFAALARGCILVGEDALFVAAFVRVDHVLDGAAAGLLFLLVVVQVRTHVQRHGLRNGRRVETAALGAHAALGEYRRHHAQVVLVPHEMDLGRVAGPVQRVEDARVVRAEAEFVDVVREVERAVVQVLLQPELHVPVPARRDVEVPLDLVALEAAVDPARVRGSAARHARRFGELATRVFSHVSQNVRDVRVFLLGPLAVAVRFGFVEALLPPSLARVRPHGEVGVFFRQQVAGHDAVHGCVLHVDVQVGAGHRDHHVQVQLKFVPDAALDGKMVRFGPHPPCS